MPQIITKQVDMNLIKKEPKSWKIDKNGVVEETIKVREYNGQLLLSNLGHYDKMVVSKAKAMMLYVDLHNILFK